MVDGQQSKRLNELGLDGRCAHHHQRLLGEYRRTLWDGVDVAGEPEMPQVVQKLLAEQLPTPQIGDILLGKVQVFDVVDELLQPRGDGEATAVRHLPEEDVKVDDTVLVAGLKIPVAHGQFVEIAEHGHVQLFLCFHPSYLKSVFARGAKCVMLYYTAIFTAAQALLLFPRHPAENTKKRQVNHRSVALLAAAATMMAR